MLCFSRIWEKTSFLATSLLSYFRNDGIFLLLSRQCSIYLQVVTEPELTWFMHVCVFFCFVLFWLFKMQSVPAHFFNQVGDADSLQVPHGGQTTQVSPLLQDICQCLLPVPAPAHPPRDQTLSLLLLWELVSSAFAPATAHQVQCMQGKSCLALAIWPTGPPLTHRLLFFCSI